VSVTAEPNARPTPIGSNRGLLTALRARTERAHALLGRWRALDRITLYPWRITVVMAAALVLTSMLRGR
jgi:hypothetical protein